MRIKCGDDFEALFVEARIAEQGGAEIADADKNDGLEAGGAEGLTDGGGETLDVVA